MEEPSFWTKAGAFVRKYILAPLPVLIIVVVGVVLVAMGAKNIQIGGLIGKLLGKKSSKKAIAKANSVPKDRVREDGTLIPIGEADSKGITQARVVPIEKPGLFDDPKKVKIRPDGGKAIEIEVPDGVKAKDVEEVVVISPEVTAVTVKNASKVSADDVDDLLARYGSS